MFGIQRFDSLLSIALVWTLTVVDAGVFVPQFVNSSSSTTAECAADCVAAELTGNWEWVDLQVTTTLTAATLIYVVNNRTNITRTETVFNKLPEGITLPLVNAEGTRTDVITTSIGLTNETTVITLAYPTAFRWQPSSYYWYGTLPTIDSMSKSVCSTAPINDKQYITYRPFVTPAQVSSSYTDPEDPKGHLKSLMYYECYASAEASLAPNDAAPTFCGQQQGSCSIAGVAALPTVQFLTDTSTSHEDNAPDPTPAPSTPAIHAVEQNVSPTPTPSGNPNNPTTAQNVNTPKPTPAPLVIGSQTFTANSQTAFVIAGQTLSAGNQIVAAGTTISLANGGSIAIVNGATQSLIPATPAAAPALTIGSQTITANAQGQFLVDGKTLAPGSTITVGSGSSKTTIDLTTNGSGQEVVVVNGKSSTLATPAKTQGIGSAVAKVVGGAEQFQGAGSHATVPLLGICMSAAVSLLLF